MSVLSRVLARVAGAARQGARPVTVFDLDSTLLSTQYRNLAILHEFVAQPGTPAALRPFVEPLGASDMGWNIMEDLHRRGFEDKDTLRALRRFWFERFFQDAYLSHDTPIPGAPEYVREVHEAGATIFYLTGRDEPNMGRGTRESLRAHAFPLDDGRVFLRLKPRFEDEDLAFKRQALTELRALGEVVAVFENEPANSNLFHEAFPAADHVFLDTVHSPNPPPLAGPIVRVKDFRR